MRATVFHFWTVLDKSQALFLFGYHLELPDSGLAWPSTEWTRNPSCCLWCWTLDCLLFMAFPLKLLHQSQETEMEVWFLREGWEACYGVCLIPSHKTSNTACSHLYMGQSLHKGTLKIQKEKLGINHLSDNPNSNVVFVLCFFSAQMLFLWLGSCLSTP